MISVSKYCDKLILLLCVLACTSSYASHVVGGDLSYRYLGETAPGTNEFRYRLSLRFYVNCGPSSSFPSILDVIDGDIGMYVGVYEHDLSAPNANKVLTEIAILYLSNYGIISPDLPDGCSLGDGQCVEESLLIGEVILPGSPNGYHLYLHHNARNAAIDNLLDPGQTGIGFHTFIPPTSVVNSSPVFVGIPVTYICVGDTTAFSNFATDPDGDSLAFSFVIPYEAEAEGGGNIQPPPVLTWPIPPVVYVTGYSPFQPFGFGGYSFIDPVTGASEYSATMQGNWVIAVEVKEYRNGELIGFIRSDLQLLSTICTGNIAPAPVGGTFTAHYEVVAGEQLCFTMPFEDLDSDTILYTSNGLVLDPVLFENAAIITDSTTLNGDLVLNFCWNTVCDQGSDEPYYFSVLVFDQACPPGVYAGTVSIDVIPSAGPLSIKGPGIGCAGQSTSTYCTEEVTNATYLWTVTGGVITTSNDGTCITVDWLDPGIGQVMVERDLDGCSISTTQPINILTSPPVAFSITTDTTCIGVKVMATDISPGSTSSSWSINGSSINSTENVVEIPISFNGTGTVGLTMTNAQGCTAYTEQVIAVGSFEDLVQYRIPNIFSPNNDNVNDRFNLITSQSLEGCFDITIYDRWGRQVFSGNAGAQGWNGKNANAEPLSAGVYYYIINVEQDQIHGNVTLVR